MLKNTASNILSNCSPLVTALVASINAEEVVIDQMIDAVESDDKAAVLAAARKLMNLRRKCTAENCAD